MSKAEIHLNIGILDFSGKGDEKWLDSQIDKILEFAKDSNLSSKAENLTKTNLTNKERMTIIDDEETGFILPDERLGIKHVSELNTKIIGTLWRKRNGLETVFFENNSTFKYNSGHNIHWTDNQYEIIEDTGSLLLTWSSDGFKSHCTFDNSFSKFSEFEAKGFTWYLISK